MNRYQYSYQEYTQMIMCYGKADENANEASRIYEQRYGRKPDPHTILRAYHKLVEKGEFKQTREREINERFEEVLDAVHNNPEVSVREIERNIGIPKSTANDILRTFKINPYHFTPVHNIIDVDYVS